VFLLGGGIATNSIPQPFGVFFYNYIKEFYNTKKEGKLNFPQIFINLI